MRGVQYVYPVNRSKPRDAFEVDTVQGTEVLQLADEEGDPQRDGLAPEEGDPRDGGGRPQPAAPVLLRLSRNVLHVRFAE